MSVLSSKAKVIRASPKSRRHDTGVNEPSGRDFSFETEKIEDEPQPNFSEFEWIRPIDQSSKQWYEQQDGSNIVWHAAEYSSRNTRD